MGSDAEKIVNFVKSNIHGIDRIICQCDKGQSRSAGVAKALMEYFSIDNKDVSENYRKYILNESDYPMPNKLVYYKVREELNRYT